MSQDQKFLQRLEKLADKYDLIIDDISDNIEAHTVDFTFYNMDGEMLGFSVVTGGGRFWHEVEEKMKLISDV